MLPIHLVLYLVCATAVLGPVHSTRPKARCRVSPWQAWGQCDRTCGGGRQEQTRTVIHAGSACPGTVFRRTRVCHTSRCPTRGGRSSVGVDASASASASASARVRTRASASARARTRASASTAHVASNNADAFDKAKSDYKAADRELEAAIAFDDPSLRDKDVGRTTTTTTTTEAPIFNGNDDDAAADALALQTQQLVATTPAPAAPRPHVPAHDPAVVASLLRGLHARFEQSSLRYGSKVNVWRASGGYMGFRVAGNVPVRKERGVQFAHGDKKAQYSFGKVVPELFTLCSVTRSPAGDDGTVLVGSDEHWYHGHYGGESGVCRYGEAHKRDASADLFIARKDGWVVLCNSNDPAAGGGQGDQELLINSGIVGSVSPSAWDAADILIWKRVLTLGEMQQMTGYLHSRLDPTRTPELAPASPAAQPRASSKLSLAFDGLARDELEPIRPNGPDVRTLRRYTVNDRLSYIAKSDDD